jgi:predicted NUDIX family phosphoesterase
VEQVYCLRASDLPAPQTEVLALEPALYQQLATSGTFFPRDEVEEDPRYRQIIPYAVVTRANEVFLVERLAAGSEARLHHRLSLGIGGHINPGVHPNARDAIEGALVRELREELHLGAFTAAPVGLIHQTGGVSSVHTGVLYLVRTTGEVRVRETEKLRGAFVSWDEVASAYARLEGWSQAALRFLRMGETSKANPPAERTASG